MSTTQLDEFRRHCRDFLAQAATPRMAQWEAQGRVDRDFWEQAGAAGLLASALAASWVAAARATSVTP
ncbi:acyl-CoA dehydrogenase family protein [Chromobacterium paludis]|uniref:acyl-CoA dehydrogenase family protein n=1 Tax=Chromobacterium paludis TaxID=2605945 RepID=UPI0018C8AD0D|nr:acyl-CoA dehydrogenase family protein [Chromobacterium paludis]